MCWDSSKTFQCVLMLSSCCLSLSIESLRSHHCQWFCSSSRGSAVGSSSVLSSAGAAVSATESYVSRGTSLSISMSSGGLTEGAGDCMTGASACVAEAALSKGISSSCSLLRDGLLARSCLDLVMLLSINLLLSLLPPPPLNYSVVSLACWSCCHWQTCHHHQEQGQAGLECQH